MYTSVHGWWRVMQRNFRLHAVYYTSIIFTAEIVMLFIKVFPPVYTMHHLILFIFCVFVVTCFNWNIRPEFASFPNARTHYSYVIYQVVMHEYQPISYSNSCNQPILICSLSVNEFAETSLRYRHIYNARYEMHSWTPHMDKNNIFTKN